MSIQINFFLKRNYLYISALLSVFAILIIAYPGRFYFLNDDFIHIPLAGEGNFIHGSLYRPLSDVSLWIDHKLWGKNAFGYHLTNLLLHLVNSFLVYKVAQIIFAQYSYSKLGELKSFLAGLLFLVYAYHSEPLFWIIGRGASLVTIFFLLAFYFYYKSNQWGGYFVCALLSFGVGLFVYETIWIFPAIVTIDYFFNEDSKDNLKRIILIWMMFFLFLGFRFVITGNLPDEYELGLVYDLKLSQLIYKYNTLLARCFLPPIKSSILFVLLYISVVGCLVCLIFRLRSRRVFFIALCLLVSVLPAISLGIDTHDSESERFIYLATVFAVFLIIDLFSYFKKSAFLLLFSLIYVFHLFKLLEASKNYEFSSMVAKKSLQYIKVTNPDTLLLFNLPKQYKGAFIFRIGFPNAINWINGQSPSNIRIVNQKEYEDAFDNLSTGKISIIQIAKQVPSIERNISKEQFDSKAFNALEIYYWQKDSLYKLSH